MISPSSGLTSGNARSARGVKLTARRWVAIALVAAAGCLVTVGQSGRIKTPDDPKKTAHPARGNATPPLPNSAKPGPTPPPDETNPEDVIRVAANLVTVPTTVVDGEGKSVDDLKLEDFQLLVDGVARPIADILRADTPVRLALLFDNSSSVSSAREFEKQAAIRFFRRVLRKQDQAAIYSITTDATLVQPLTGDTRLLIQGIESFGKPEGATALFDGVVMAADYLKQHLGRRVVIIVSDGDDTISNTEFENSVRIAQAADCQIYVVQTTKIENAALNGDANGSANLRALAAERRMEEYAAQTGGTVYSPFSTKELDPAFSQIAADLAEQYILSYYPQDETFDGRFRLLTVRVNRPNLRVRARKGYYTPKS